MAAIEIACPGCKTVLKVPGTAVGKKGRCRACGKTFEILLPLDISSPFVTDRQDDDTILAWLVKDDGSGKVSDASQTPEIPPDRTGREVKTFPVRLDHVDTMGAFFLFSAELLYDDDFRCAFPQQCIICSSQRGLSVHLMVWSSKLASLRHGDQQDRSIGVLPLKDLDGLKGRELLARLPLVDNIPQPFCLPLPYYVCDSCSAVGAMVTDVHVSHDGHGEECELGISSLRMAEKFAEAVCGSESDVPREIRRARKKRKGDAWQKLPLAIRVRLQRWYQPGDGEKFLAYFQDADYTKAEAGLAGLVITDKRLVYHKSMAQIEMDLGNRIAINSVPRGNGIQLEIASSGGEVAKLSALPAYAAQITELLRRQGQYA